jgi:hypothetical protein
MEMEKIIILVVLLAGSLITPTSVTQADEQMYGWTGVDSIGTPVYGAFGIDYKGPLTHPGGNSYDALNSVVRE